MKPGEGSGTPPPERVRKRHRNGAKMVEIGSIFWNATESAGLAGIVAERRPDGRLVTESGHEFENYSCCSYLDLDSHPKIIEGAITALRRYGVLDHCIARIRLQLPALLELEASLSSLFGAKVTCAISASAATAGILPFLASGHLTGGTRPVMAFDKHCHFSMNLFKPVCADEALVVTTPHNDLDFIEDLCRRHERVAYVSDGTYSMGGHVPIEGLLELQDRYGLFIYLDDSHSLSIVGEHGEGFVRSSIGELNEHTMIVATLNKAFGTSGGAVMWGLGDRRVEKILERFGGPMAWSQPMNIAAIGASLASAEIHRTPELGERQRRLQDNIRLFDRLVDTPQVGNLFPIKLVRVEESQVVPCAEHLFQHGFYVSPVFFPIVERNKAGLRVMLRAGNPEQEITRLCQLIRESTDRDRGK